MRKSLVKLIVLLLSFCIAKNLFAAPKRNKRDKKTKTQGIPEQPITADSLTKVEYSAFKQAAELQVQPRARRPDRGRSCVSLPSMVQRQVSGSLSASCDWLGRATG